MSWKKKITHWFWGQYNLCVHPYQKCSICYHSYRRVGSIALIRQGRNFSKILQALTRTLIRHSTRFKLSSLYQEKMTDLVLFILLSPRFSLAWDFENSVLKHFWYQLWRLCLGACGMVYKVGQTQKHLHSNSMLVSGTTDHPL